MNIKLPFKGLILEMKQFVSMLAIVGLGDLWFNEVCVYLLRRLDLKNWKQNIGVKKYLFGINGLNKGRSWALEVFFNFFNNKKWFFGIFYKVDNLFLHQSYLKSPLPVKLT